MNNAVKSTVALTAICAAVCTALAFVNMLTKDRISQTENNALQQSLRTSFGDGDYIKLDEQHEGINQVILDRNGQLIYDITSSGYEKNSQHLLIGIADGAVTKVQIVSILDSPTQAAAVSDSQFLEQFRGQTDPDAAFDAVSGATKSSAGIRNAVSAALKAYYENRELNENE